MTKPKANTCPHCQRLKRRLGRILEENTRLHELAAHYREQVTLQRQSTSPPTETLQ